MQETKESWRLFKEDVHVNVQNSTFRNRVIALLKLFVLIFIMIGLPIILFLMFRNTLFNKDYLLNIPNKLEDFISTPELDKVTKELLDYIDDTNSNKPYFISGRSGSGKSALMAHIIDEAEKNLKKISYIFIGTTPRSTNLNYVLSYLLGDNMPYVETEDGNITIKNAKISLSSQDDEGISSKEDIFSYKDMCKKAVETINALGQKEENFVFMIDAIDQLNTNNNPEWIPEILPSNVKLIISILNDNNYSDDSSAYKFIKDRNYKVIELKKYSKALDLLENTLKKKNRKVTQEQSNYFLEQYKDAQTPFFIKMAAMEMAEWRSYDVIKKDVDLANNSKGVHIKSRFDTSS